MKHLLTLFLMIVLSWTAIAQNQLVAYSTSIPAQGYEACKFKFSALVRMESKDTNARTQLWIRIDKPTGRGFFENMSKRPIRDQQWKTYTIEGRLDSNGTRIAFGLLAYYSGSFFYDNFQLDVETKNGEWKTLYKNDFEDGVLGLKQGIGTGTNGIDTLYKAEIIRTGSNEYLKIEAPDAFEFYQKNLNKLREDTNKVNLIYRIARFYRDKSDREKALQYFDEGLNLAYKIKFERGKLRYFYSLGNMYDITGSKNYDKAVEYYKKGLEQSQKLGLRRDVAAFASNLVRIYELLGNLPEVTKYAYVTLKAYESLQDKARIAEIHRLLAVDMGLQKNYSKALEHYRVALNIQEKLNNKNELAQCHVSIGEIYVETGHLDSAQINISKAIDLFTALGSQAYPWGLAFSYSITAKMQLKKGELYAKKTEKAQASIYFKEALTYFIKSQKLLRTQFSQTMGDEMDIDIGISHFKLNNLILADSFLTSGIKAFVGSELGDASESIDYKRNAYLYLSKIDSIRGNWKASHAHYQQYIAARDQLYNEENTKKTTTYQLQYEFDLKEAAQKAEQDKKELALQKELELKALNFEYEKKQAAAKSEKEKQQLKYEQQLKQQQIEASYARKTAQIEAEQKRKEAVAKLEQEKRNALNASALALSQAEVQRQSQQRNFFIVAFAFLAVLIGLIGYAYSQKQRANKLLQAQKAEIDQKSLQLQQSLTELKSTQSQLIQSEKLASLGELTAGIAHEIQNPLNFVNNFAEVSAEMLDEMHEELEKGDTTEAIAIATDLKTNLEKINHHGKRASSIVKGMLEHSRVSTGVKESTDLNALADEYLRLAYHGLRAKDSSFNATLETHFDPDLPLVSVILQDIGRVLLNLINNAFYAVAERSRSTIGAPLAGAQASYMPTVTVSTKKLDNAIEISVKDNGPGIPDSIREKIFQPFFTTKPTGQGTGLGLSLAYDIVTKGHGGTLEVDTKKGENTTMIIRLPFQ